MMLCRAVRGVQDMFRLAFSLAGKARRYQQVMGRGVGARRGREP